MRALEDVRTYCAAKPGAKETFPFGAGTLVFKVMGKMFALTSLADTPLWVSLKCEPELAELLRGKYQAVVPGYHLNKRHWNSVRLDGSVPGEVVRELIDLSYTLVVRGLGKSARQALSEP